MNCLNGPMYWWSINISFTNNQQDNNCTWCWQEGNLPPEVIMQHPTVCSSCVPRQHARGVAFESTAAIFGVFVPQRASSSLIKHPTALCYRKSSKRICSACFPASPSCFCQPADKTEEATAFSAASVLFKSSLLWSSLLRSHPCPGTPAVLWGAGSARALQAKHSWVGKTTWCVWNSSASLLRDVTMRILCGADFLSFQWVGVESCTGSLWLLGHCSKSFHGKELLLVKEGLSGWMWNTR